MIRLLDARLRQWADDPQLACVVLKALAKKPLRWRRRAQSCARRPFGATKARRPFRLLRRILPKNTAWITASTPTPILLWAAALS